MSAALKVHLDRGDGRARCGRRQGIPVTTSETQVTCGFCLNILAGINHGGIQPLDLKPHGTAAAARRHYRHGEPLCRPCSQLEQRRAQDRDTTARNERARSRYAALRASGVLPREAQRLKWRAA